MILTQDIIDQLSNQAKQKKLITGEYITDTSNENYQYMKRKFFPLETNEKAQVLISGSGLFESVANTISYYVGNTSLSFEIPMSSMTKDYIALGYATMGLERIDGKLKTIYLPAENYIKYNGIDHIIRAYTITENLVNTYYYLITSYDGGKIENHLYESDGINFSLGREVPLDTIDETSELEEVVNTGLPQVFRYITDDILDPTPISLIDQIKQIVYSIDRNVVMYDTQFLQNVESFVLLKGLNLPTYIMRKYSEGKIDFADLGRYITTDQDGKIEFVNNQNPLLQQSIDYERNRIARVSAISNVPMDFLGGAINAGAIGEGSRELLHGSFIKRILSIRELFDKSIQSLIDVMKSQDSSIIDTYTRDDVFSKNTKQLIEEIEKAVNIGLISKRTALKRYLGLTESEIDIELDLLANENNETETDQEDNIG